MLSRLEKEIAALHREHPEVWLRGRDNIGLRKRLELEAGAPRFGTVVDNRDPEFLGRVRVACDTIAPGAVTPWIQVVALGAGKNQGWWQLPDVGSQVLMAFVGKGHSRPVVLGNIHDEKHLPPKPSTEKPGDSKLYQTRAHRLEFIDEGGKESIILSSAKGQIRVVLSKDKGIEIANELGDIKIKCRKLKVEGKEGVALAAEKGVKVQGGDKSAIKAKGGIRLESGKETRLKGNNIKFETSKGLTTGGKQLAAQGDKVVGFDVHQMVVPSGTGTAVVPLPHPFIGKLADKLSKDVKINGHNAAAKGSVAKHDDPMHNQLPGTIKFQQNPKKEGEVTGGTGAKVKINGKEAAVIGSTVTTCNDVGARDNSAVIAPGASVPMPTIINPKNMEEYLLEREGQEKREPEFSSAKWVKTSVKEGEKAEMSAQVKDIDDGNMATFQVWRQGQDPAAHVPLAQVMANVEGGEASGEFSYGLPRNELLPDEDPEFFFTAHSAWCPPKQSGNLKVGLLRPEVTKCEWLDDEGSATGKGLAGQALKLSAIFNADAEEGAAVSFRVYREGADPKWDKPELETGAKIKDGKAEAEWTYHYRHDPENPLKEKPKYFFTVNSHRCKEAESGNVEISQTIKISIEGSDGEPKTEIEYEICAPDGSLITGESDDEGKILKEGLVPGPYTVMLADKKEENNG